jgi:uncharacterized protein (DUF302 family)
MKRLLRITTYALAAVAVAGGGLGVYVYRQGLEAQKRLDPKATEVFGEFARRLLTEDAASASVIKLPLAEGVSPKEAIASMEARAAARNIKLIGRLSLHKELEARTKAKHPMMEVLQFCEATTAARLLAYNLDFLAHMPCSIGLYQDANGKGWLVTLNLDLLIHGGPEIDPELKERVLAVKESMLDIMAAGAEGAL